MGKNLKDVEVIVIFFTGKLELALERNAQRTGRAFVPESTIRNMYHSIDLPSYVLEPYIDDIYIVNANNNEIINIKEESV